MDDAQLQTLIRALDDRPKASQSKEVVDGLSKLAVGLCLAGILWVGTQINQQDRKLIEIEVNQKQIVSQMHSFQKFTDAPRFTRPDFLSEMRLYEKRLELIEQELRYRSEFMNETNERLKGIP